MRKRLSFLMIIVLVLGVYGGSVRREIVHAWDVNEPIDEIIEPEPWICENEECQSLILNATDYGTVRYMGKTTHKYDFLTKTCTYSIYHNQGRHYCQICGWWDYIRMSDGTIAYHECYQIHQNCGKGRSSVCALGY